MGLSYIYSFLVWTTTKGSGTWYILYMAKKDLDPYDYRVRPDPLYYSDDKLTAYTALRGAGFKHLQSADIVGSGSPSSASRIHKKYKKAWAEKHLPAARKSVLAYAKGQAVNGIAPKPSDVLTASQRIMDLAGEVVVSKSEVNTRAVSVTLTAKEVLGLDIILKRHYSESIDTPIGDAIDTDQV